MIYAHEHALYKFSEEKFEEIRANAYVNRRSVHEQILHENVTPYIPINKANISHLTHSRK